MADTTVVRTVSFAANAGGQGTMTRFQSIEDGAIRNRMSMVFLIVFAGCVSPVASIAPPAAELRARMDPVILGVFASSKPDWSSTESVITDPGERGASASARGAKAGHAPMKVGCHWGWQYLWIITCPLGVGIGVGTAVVGGLSGGIYGAATASTPEEMDSAQAAVDKALRETRFENRLRDHVASEIRSKSRVSVVEVESHEALRGRQGHDAVSGLVLELDISRFRLTRQGELSPDLWLDMAVEAHVHDSLQNPPLYMRQWGLKIKLGDYFGLTDKGAADLNVRLDAQLRRMAAAIVDDLFVTQARKQLRHAVKNGQIVSTSGYSD
jgi:hypothetical protein